MSLRVADRCCGLTIPYCTLGITFVAQIAFLIHSLSSLFASMIPFVQFLQLFGPEITACDESVD